MCKLSLESMCTNLNLNSASVCNLQHLTDHRLSCCGNFAISIRSFWTNSVESPVAAADDDAMGCWICWGCCWYFIAVLMRMVVGIAWLRLFGIKDGVAICCPMFITGLAESCWAQVKLLLLWFDCFCEVDMIVAWEMMSLSQCECRNCLGVELNRCDNSTILSTMLNYITKLCDASTLSKLSKGMTQADDFTAQLPRKSEETLKLQLNELMNRGKGRWKVSQNNCCKQTKKKQHQSIKIYRSKPFNDAFLHHLFTFDSSVWLDVVLTQFRMTLFKKHETVDLIQQTACAMTQRSNSSIVIH
jgi:hypothetical protein